jgi:hypothetical protein
VAFGVVDLDHPVPIVIEDAGVEQFVLGSCPPRAAFVASRSSAGKAAGG